MLPLVLTEADAVKLAEVLYNMPALAVNVAAESPPRLITIIFAVIIETLDWAVILELN